VNYLVYPLQILLAWPFARLGGLLFGGARGFWALTLNITLAWACFAVPAGLVAYLVVRRVLRHRRQHCLEQA
jgi:membrane protein implicated in regulation of membrane protease activity